MRYTQTLRFETAGLGVAASARRCGRSRRWITAALTTGILAAMFCASAQPVEPCESLSGGRIDEDDVVHDCGLASERVPVVGNFPDPVTGVRPYNPLVQDPIAAKSNITFDGTIGAYRWSTSNIVPAGDGPTPVFAPLFPSACTHPLYYRRKSADSAPISTFVRPELPDRTWGQIYGFSLGINLMAPLSLGDFLPRGATLVEDSVCLVPAATESQPTGWQSLSRPTLEKTVDLITGAPLIQVTDLELPFDGATFRLNRTRSAPDQRGADVDARIPPTFSDGWWDWTGVGWMASENPLLIIDSSVPDIVGERPLTTRLVLDAHRSIPFQILEDSGRYEAPPRFRASMTHNGEWGVIDIPTGRKGWIQPPTQYEIYLYEKALKYTFVAIREDVPANEYDSSYLDDGIIGGPVSASSYHDRPWLSNSFWELDPPLQPGDSRWDHNPFNHERNKGFGVPYYGICKKITDRYGHEVEMEYCDSVRRHMDDPATDDCIECQQDGLAKGQLKSIRLKSGGVTKWTLLYVHKRFPGLRWEITEPSQDDDTSPYDLVSNVCPNDDPRRYELHGYNAIHRIYVYEGDVASSTDSGHTVHHNAPYGWQGDVGVGDPLPVGFPNEWKYQVRYQYAYWIDGTYGSSDSYHILREKYPWLYGGDEGWAKGPPLLLMTSVATPDSSVDGNMSIDRRIYDYVQPDGGRSVDDYDDDKDLLGEGPWLTAVYEEADIQRIVTQSAAMYLGGQLSAPITVKQLASLDPDPIYANARGEFARSNASLLLELPLSWNYPWPSTGSYGDHPSSTALITEGYITREPTRLYADHRPATAEAVSLRSADGNSRHFRVHRLAHIPASSPWGAHSGTDFESAFPDNYEPMLSQWFVPYAWQGYSVHRDDLGGDAFPNLEEPRYIVIIDEFRSRDEMMEGLYGAEGGDHPGVKPARRAAASSRLTRRV